ncbi:MAG: DUF4923 family protein [Prevotella sp.]|nr:DUF4923 family protein [Prevotella sp.]
MKKSIFVLGLAALSLMMGSCGTNSTLSQVGAQVLNNVLLGSTGTTTTTGNTTTDNATGVLGNILNSVLGGSSKPTLQQLVGTWKYSQPGCAFTSDQLLAQAGGEVVASQIKAKLQPTFQKIGIKSSNTSITLNENKTFALSLAGKSFSGNFAYNEDTQQLTLQGLLLTINCYAKRNSDGIALLFESSKLLTLLQTLSALSGNATLQTVGDLSKSYDGMRIGFDFK